MGKSSLRASGSHSSSYRQATFGPGASTLVVGCAVVSFSSPITDNAALLVAADVPGGDASARAACALDHCSLVEASKKPEFCARIRRCSTYRRSWPSAAIVISTSPVSAKFGNSFCGRYVPPPTWDRWLRCRRVVVLRDDTDDGRRTATARSGAGAWSLRKGRWYVEADVSAIACPAPYMLRCRQDSGRLSRETLEGAGLNGDRRALLSGVRGAARSKTLCAKLCVQHSATLCLCAS